MKKKKEILLKIFIQFFQLLIAKLCKKYNLETFYSYFSFWDK